jgi:DNA-binding beta-propeller fold protein YncE
MYSWLVWIVFGAVAVVLGAVGYGFSLRTLRWVALIVVAAIAAYLTAYGLTHPAREPGSLPGAFARGADTLSGALIRPLSMGYHVPVPGRIGWLVIVALLVLGYRGLEAWAMGRQAPCLDLLALTSDRQDDPADAETNAQTGRELHDWLAAELNFRLPAVEIRMPAIFPGGSRPSGLASIAEATGVNGAGLVGAIIRFFGMIWPSPPRIQVRAWVERTPGQPGIDGPKWVTVGLADPQSGASIATKTLAAASLDDAAAAVAGYVARHIFARDRTVPPWSASATDGSDLAALLRARQVRGYPECREEIRGAWDRQIEILEGVARGNLCAGVVRYELAQLYDLTGRHVEALLLHAVNREHYPRFYRGRYRLAMSLEMLANPHFEFSEADMATLTQVQRILDRCGVPDSKVTRIRDDGEGGLPECLTACLLAAARQELLAIQRYLTWRHIIWGSLRHRNERAVLRPYRRPRHRQAFHDGVCVALLLVAVRQALADKGPPKRKLRHARTIARIAIAISGHSEDFTSLQCLPAAKAPQRQQPMGPRMRTRRWPWQYSTPSWPAAYNLACAYAALAANKASTAGADVKTTVDPLVTKVIDSLEFALCNPECEMERPSEWIRNDPDFSWLCGQKYKGFAAFLDGQGNRDYPADGRRAGPTPRAPVNGLGGPVDVAGRGLAARSLAEHPVLSPANCGDGGAAAGVEVLRAGGSLAPAAVRTIPVAGAPLGVTITPDGRYLLVADDGGAVVISVPQAERGTSGAVLGTLSVPGAGAGDDSAIEVAVSPDGQFAFVTLEYADRAVVFNLGQALRAGFGAADYVGGIPLGQAAVGMAVSPDGRWLYATSEVAGAPPRSPAKQPAAQPPGTLTVIGLRRAETDPASSAVATVDAGCQPVRVITSGDGSAVWVTARASDDLLCFSAARLISDPAYALVAIARVGEAPVGLAAVRGGSLRSPAARQSPATSRPGCSRARWPCSRTARCWYRTTPPARSRRSTWPASTGANAAPGLPRASSRSALAAVRGHRYPDKERIPPLPELSESATGRGREKTIATIPGNSGETGGLTNDAAGSYDYELLFLLQAARGR